MTRVLGQRRISRPAALGWLTIACALAGFALAAAVLAPSLVGRKAFLPADHWWLRSQPWVSMAPPEVRSFPSNLLLTDSATLYAPQLWVARESLRSGGLLLWNPYFGCGEPLLGAGTSGPLAPTNLPVLLLPWPHGFAWSALLRFGLMWAGAFLLGRALGLARSWSLALAVGFCFAPAFILHFQQPRGAILVWLPWLLLCVERLAAGAEPGGRALLRAALPIPLLVLAMALGGHPPSAFNVVLGVALYAFVRLPGSPRRAALDSRLALAAALVLGVALSAPVLAPFVETLRDSMTFGQRQHAGAWVLGPEAYRLFWDPLALGSPLPGSPGPWLGASNIEEEQQYVGLLPWVFLLGCAPLAWRSRGPDGARLAALGCVALLCGALAYGWPPLHGWLTALPPFSFNRNPRFLILLQTGVILAAALLARRWLEPGPRPRARAAGLLLAAAALGAALCVALDERWHGRPLLVLASAAALFCAGRLAASPGQRSAAAALVPLLLLADLAPVHRRYHPQVPGGWADPAIARAALPQALRDDPALRMAPQWTAPNLPALFGAVDAWSYSLPVPRRYELYTRGVMGLADPTVVSPAELLRPDVFTALERSCATWLMSTLPEGAAVAERLAPVERRGNVRYDRFRDGSPWSAWHREQDVSVVDGLRPAVQRVRSGLNYFPEPIVVEDAGRTAARRPKQAGIAAPARQVTTERIEIEVPAAARSEAGYLVVRTSYDRGWSARSGAGAPLRVLPAQVRFLAVEAPAGTDRIVLQYRPLHAGATLAAACGALLALSLGLLATFPAPRRRWRS